VAFDLAVLASTEVAREHDVRRHSLNAFADQVRVLTAPEAAIDAAIHLPENDRLVLQYLLDRPLPRRRMACPDTHLFLAPLAGASDHAHVLASSTRHGTIVALLRCADPPPVDGPGSGG